MTFVSLHCVLKSECLLKCLFLKKVFWGGFFNPHVDLYPSKVHPPETERCLQSRRDRAATSQLILLYGSQPQRQQDNMLTTILVRLLVNDDYVSYCDTNNVTYGCYSVKFPKIQ